MRRTRKENCPQLITGRIQFSIRHLMFFRRSRRCETNLDRWSFDGTDEEAGSFIDGLLVSGFSDLSPAAAPVRLLLIPQISLNQISLL